MPCLKKKKNTMNKFICLHGHFYQPPRENPWLEKIEQQDSAHPFHDWNERITYECYEPNTASRILAEDKKIIDIVNNYAGVSFNFGPTLLSWLEKNNQAAYDAIMDADRISRTRFSGHGSAIAQAYNHMIMPLANERDKRTQVIWGIRDFEHRFKRKPEGMWLPETATDTSSLEVLAENGIRFTILSPHQAGKYRKTGDEQWNETKEKGIDTRRPYLCNLPSGKNIVIFFYNGNFSNAIAFQGLLKNGKQFAEHMLSGYDEKGEENQLVHVATDGESYGHHHRYGDMALAYCLHYIRENSDVILTIYGEYLEKHPPEYEVEINENTSWSCAHGIERWRSNCGCKGSHDFPGTQEWRKPLREALDWLRDEMSAVYEEKAGTYLKDPWQARDDYIRVLLERSSENSRRFLDEHACSDISREERITVRKLLEMQRHAMLMYTSCGWFFDDISGIETIQILRYAGRAIQLSRDISGNDLEKGFLSVLGRAKSHYPRYKDGAHIYRKYVRESIIDLLRVGAHYAISSLFIDYPKDALINEYRAFNKAQHKLKAGNQELGVGKTDIRSNITEEEKIISYAVLYLGDHNVMCGVREFMENGNFVSMLDETREAFNHGNIAGVIQLMDKHFGMHNYSFWHLFKDEQRNLLNRILENKMETLTNTYRRLFNEHYGLTKVIMEMDVPVPKVLSVPAEYILQNDLQSALNTPDPDIREIKRLAGELRDFEFSPAEDTGFVLNNQITKLMEHLRKSPDDVAILKRINTLFGIAGGLAIEMDLWKIQNATFYLWKSHYENMNQKAENGNHQAGVWLKQFRNLAGHLNVKVV